MTLEFMVQLTKKITNKNNDVTVVTFMLTPYLTYMVFSLNLRLNLSCSNFHRRHPWIETSTLSLLLHVHIHAFW